MASVKYSGLPAKNQVSRRNFITAAPAVGFAAMLVGAAPVEASPVDPVLALCRAYHAADNEVERLASLPGGEDYGTPEILTLCDQRIEAFRTLSQMVPTSLEGVAAMATVLVAEDVGPVEASFFAPDDWMKYNIAKGARALLAL